MTLKARAGLFLTGLAVVLYGYVMWHKHGIFPYLNSKMQPMYPAGVIAVGVVIGMLAFLPSGGWVYRSISTKPRREGHVLRVLDESRHKHQEPDHSSNRSLR